jgi:hypothetical protein
MRRASKKTKRDFNSVQVETPSSLPVFAPMEEHDGFKVGEKVWFNTSLVGEKYSWGTIREIRQQPNGNIAFTVWDEMKGMWRSFSSVRLHREKPTKPRRSRRET